MKKIIELFKEYGIRLIFMIPEIILRRYIPVCYKRGFIPLDSNGFYYPRSNPRKSLFTAARIFNEIKGKVIIEIGSGVQGYTSGNSVLVWAARTCAEKIVALDMDEHQIRTVKEAVEGQYPQVEARLEDGIEYVRNFNKKIDLLYLDFWTPDPEGALPGTGRAEAYLKAYLAAKEKLSNKALILIDDTDHVHPWKHTYIIPEARKDGFKVVYTGRQTLLRRGKRKEWENSLVR
jgi:hypothetical protein